MTDEEIRALAIKDVESKGYTVEMVGSGSGVPKSSRLELTKPGKPPEKCVVKITTSGRISFPFNDGKFTPLHEMDCVLYAYHRGDGTVRVQMFRREVIETAFNTLRAALTAKGKEHIPHWLAPFHEDGERFTGSGFGDKADWTTDIDAPGTGSSSPAPVKAVAAPARGISVGEAVEQAKALIAGALGRPPSEIDLTISFKS